MEKNKRVKDISVGDVLYIVNEKTFDMTERTVIEIQKSHYDSYRHIMFKEDLLHIDASKSDYYNTFFRHLSKTGFIYKDDADKFLRDINNKEKNEKES